MGMRLTVEMSEKRDGSGSEGGQSTRIKYLGDRGGDVAQGEQEPSHSGRRRSRELHVDADGLVEIVNTGDRWAFSGCFP